MGSANAQGTLVLSTSMESAGSGWLYSLTNSMLQAAGRTDAREIQREYELDDVMRWHNCNIRDLDQPTWDRLLAPLNDGHSFVVKSHRPPTKLAIRLCEEGAIKVTYIHRDPRDVVMSAYERGKVRRANDKRDSFARLRTVDLAIAWMRYRQLPVYEAWRFQPNTQVIRYEDLASDGVETLRRLDSHLQLMLSDADLERILDTSRGTNAGQQEGSHFRGGGRRREAMTPMQLRRCTWACRSAIRTMGYEL